VGAEVKFGAVGPRPHLGLSATPPSASDFLPVCSRKFPHRFRCSETIIYFVGITSIDDADPAGYHLFAGFFFVGLAAGRTVLLLPVAVLPESFFEAAMNFTPVRLDNAFDNRNLLTLSIRAALNREAKA